MTERIGSLLAFLAVSALMAVTISTCPSGPSPILSDDRGASYVPGDFCLVQVGTPEEFRSRLDFCADQFQTERGE